VKDVQGQEAALPQDGTAYCFVYRRPREDRRDAWIEILIWVSLLVFLLSRKPLAEMWAETGVWLLLLISTLLRELLELLFPGDTLLVDSEGMTLRWRWLLFPRVKRLRWPEIALVRWRESRSLLSSKPFRALQCFYHEAGRMYELEVIRFGAPVYAGVGHDLSLPEVIGKFRPLMAANKMADKAATKAMWKQLWKSFWSGPSPLSGRETAHIAYAALALCLLLALLAPFHHTRALETTGQHIFFLILYWGVGLGSALAALGYARRRGKGEQAVIQAFLPAILFGGACGFLMIPLLHGVPAWLGEARHEPFVIVREDENRQHWQGVDSPELAFTLPLAPDERVYRMPGKPRVFTIYRGPFGLAVMERHEYRALSRFGEK
jgi:hypothetical protein